MIDQNKIKAKWHEVKGEIRKAWGNLSSDELEQTQGQPTKLADLLERKYGYTHEKAEERIENLLAKFVKGPEQDEDQRRANKMDEEGAATQASMKDEQKKGLK